MTCCNIDGKNGAPSAGVLMQTAWIKEFYDPQANAPERFQSDEYMTEGRSHAMAYACCIEAPSTTMDIASRIGRTKERTVIVLEQLAAEGYVGFDWEIRQGGGRRKIWKALK